MRIIDLEFIKQSLDGLDIIPAIEEGFALYSAGKAVIPPVGELLFQNPPGDVHIKYGYLSGDNYYVIKIASGFYYNPKSNLPSSNGLMLLFDQRNGNLLCILLDEGYLTDHRTAIAGHIAAKHLAPRTVRRIGIVGTGVQARLQLLYLRKLMDCREVIVWGRHPEHLKRVRQDLSVKGFAVSITQDMAEVAATCNLIVTATLATSPLLDAQQVRPGTHITAMGADTPSKQELDPVILKNADLVVADSVAQCLVRGEIAHAIRDGLLEESEVKELGDIIARRTEGRTSDDQVTVADLTGVAVQDIQIAKAVYQANQVKESCQGTLSIEPAYTDHEVDTQSL